MRFGRVEGPTLALIALCYAAWALGVFALAPLSLGFAVGLVALAVALHSSLQHEVIHGHPTANAHLNAALVFPNLGLLIPYGRFRDTHLAHHKDADLTDPYDDPETQYLAPQTWARLPMALRALLLANNTLLGRVVLGTLVSQAVFMAGDWKAVRQGDRSVLGAWVWHLPAVGVVLAAVFASAMPLWAYLLAAYLGLSLIKVRTFLEHQAHDRAAARSAIIEDRGPLALLFLHNNLHAVHHAHPGVPWYALPGLYAQQRGRFLAMNGGYVIGSYAEVARRYLFRRKEPVPHPLWPLGPRD